MIGYMATLAPESIVDVTGVVVKPEVAPKNCSIKLELQVHTVYCVNTSRP